MVQEVIQPEMDYVLEDGPLLQAVANDEMDVEETESNSYYLDRQSEYESNARSYQIGRAHV